MMKKISCYFTIILIFFAMLLCVDPDTLKDTANSNIIVPFISVKPSIIIFIFTIISILLLTLRRVIKINLILILLLLRLLLYLIPMIYIDGEISIGLIMAVFQCFAMYFIGLNFKGEFKDVLKILIVFSLIIIGEQLYVVFTRNLGLFTPDLKHFMVLPLGRYNYLTCFLLPIYFMVDTYYTDKKNRVLKFLYTILIIIGILCTGSKLAIVIFLLYYIVKVIRYLSKLRIKPDNINIAILSICMVLVFTGLAFGWLISKDTFFKKFFEFSTYQPRLMVYQEGIKLFLQYPFLGRSSIPYQIYDAVSAHNFLLESLIQTGIFGTVIYMTILILVVKKIIKINDPKIKIVSIFFFSFVLIHGMAEPNVFGVSFDTFFWFLIGIFTATPSFAVEKEYKVF